MCWRTKELERTNNCNALIAKEDIHCYKIVKLNDEYGFRSMYRNFKYEIGVEYENSDSLALSFNTINKTFEIYNGFHSYSYESTTCEVNRRHYGYNEWKIRNINKELLDWIGEFNAIQVECIIPKGSKYFLNERGEYVSDKIKIIGRTEN